MSNFWGAVHMGAFIGAFYAGGMSAKEIYDLAVNFGLFDTPKVIIPSMLSKSGLVKGKKIEEFLRNNLPVQRFEDLKIPMKISATDYWNKKEYVFSSGDIVPAVRASISIPGIFQPYHYRDKLFVDGALVNPVPFDLLPDDNFIIAIDVIGNDFLEGEKFPGITDVLIGSFHVMKKAIMEQRGMNDKINIYRTPDLTEFNSLSFHKSEKIISTVKQDMKQFKEEIKTIAVAE